NWPSDGAAELITFQSVGEPFAVRTFGRERIGRVYSVVAKELEQVTVNLVGPGFGDGVDRSPGVETVLRGKGAGFDLKLLQGVRERQGKIQIVVRVVVGRAVQHVRNARR